MNNASAILRTLIVYSICVPVAIWLGYLLTSMADLSRSTFIEAGVFALVLSLPLLLRWHYFLLVFTLNLSMTVFFLPGQPPLWMLVLVLSLGISILQRALNKGMHFISAPQITKPLICLAIVVLVTAKLTGGIGLRSLGGEAMGGKKYFFVLGGILAYFALTARRIPPHRAGFYVGLFFLSQCLSVIGDLDTVLPSAFNFLYWFFPPNGYVLAEMQAGGGSLRLSGVAIMSSGFFIFMLAKYGIRGIFLSGKFWRPIIFVGLSSLVVLGGFRAMVVTMAIIFFIQFYAEGLHRTKLLLRLVVVGMLAFAMAVPFAQKLPLAAQRALSFLPGVKVDLAAKEDAQASADWRFDMWKAELPQVPEHLILGKGYVLTQQDYEFATSRTFGIISSDQNGSAVAGDYHNGPLSVILPFGIWGAIAFLWLLAAGIRATYNNYKYGDPSLQNINTLLFSLFVGHAIAFFLIFGAMEADTLSFAAMLGLSISLNGGISRPAADQAQPATPVYSRPRLQMGFQR